MILDIQLIIVHYITNTTLKVVSPRDSLIGWGPRLMKRRSLVLITHPPLV
jgi:hypothetical protein